jgi:hypothetical protein
MYGPAAGVMGAFHVINRTQAECWVGRSRLCSLVPVVGKDYFIRVVHRRHRPPTCKTEKVIFVPSGACVPSAVVSLLWSCCSRTHELPMFATSAQRVRYHAPVDAAHLALSSEHLSVRVFSNKDCCRLVAPVLGTHVRCAPDPHGILANV